MKPKKKDKGTIVFKNTQPVHGKLGVVMTPVKRTYLEKDGVRIYLDGDGK